ncbi:hypothetical protein BKA69DRAFT_1046294 [Paraphysoderma sedebokerense]|nr:hypothetical protein BKA69DRAFT_1046294 [Paraphysoderma sedebokerense]
MADTNISPWDPLFWMHHGGVDYWWAQWESAGNAGSYNGPSVTMGNLRHTDAVDYQNRLCYRYDGIDGRNTTSSSPGNQRGRASPSPSANANQTDIVIPDLNSIPDDKLKSFNIKREDINQFDGIFKAIAAYLKQLKDQGKPLPSVESLKSFKFPKPIEDIVNRINENPPTEDKKSDDQKPEDNKPEGGNAEGQKSSAIGFIESRLPQIFGFTFASLLALTL